MKRYVIFAAVMLFSLACNKAAAPPNSLSMPAPKSDSVQQKLQQYAGLSATDCGRLGVHPSSDQSKAASDCAIGSSQGKRPFYVAYDMPGMIVGVAGNSEGKLFSVRSEGDGASAVLTTGDCPSQLRVAGSGRVTCFAPGDMGSMGGGHTAIPPGMPNPHAFPKSQ